MTEQPAPRMSWRYYVQDRDVHFGLLRRELERELAAFSAQMDERFQAQERAVVSFSESNQRALEKVNEFRQSLVDQNARFATIDSLRGLSGKVEAGTSEIMHRISKLETDFAARQGKDDQSHASNRTLILYMGIAIALMELAVRFMWR